MKRTGVNGPQSSVAARFDRYFFFGFGVGSLLGVSQQGFFSILPLALHLNMPFFSFTHMVSFGSVPNAVEINANKARSVVRGFILSRSADASYLKVGSGATPERFSAEE